MPTALVEGVLSTNSSIGSSTSARLFLIDCALLYTSRRVWSEISRYTRVVAYYCGPVIFELKLSQHPAPKVLWQNCVLGRAASTCPLVSPLERLNRPSIVVHTRFILRPTEFSNKASNSPFTLNLLLVTRHLSFSMNGR